VSRRTIRAAVVDSKTFRSWSRSAAGRALLGSPAREKIAGLARGAAIARSRRKSPELFAETRTCFLMVGHTKSGGSLLGSLLDAHPSIVCADELGLARLLAEDSDRDAAFRLVVRNAQRESARDRVTSRRVEAYSLRVPGTSQGKTIRPVAIGDARAGPTTRYLAAHPGTLTRIAERLDEVSLRLIHVVRNPFDPVAFMVVRSGRPLRDAIEDYASQCERMLALRASLADGAVVTVRYEDLVGDPSGTVRDVCALLGVAPDEEHVQACVSVVNPTTPERHRIAWPATEIQALESVIDDFDFLAGYEFGVTA
jgi:hypothetical protein